MKFPKLELPGVALNSWTTQPCPLAVKARSLVVSMASPRMSKVVLVQLDTLGLQAGAAIVF